MDISMEEIVQEQTLFLRASGIVHCGKVPVTNPDDLNFTLGKPQGRRREN